jgi:hypothetical protein
MHTTVSGLIFKVLAAAVIAVGVVWYAFDNEAGIKRWVTITLAVLGFVLAVIVAVQHP